MSYLCILAFTCVDSEMTQVIQLACDAKLLMRKETLEAAVRLQRVAVPADRLENEFVGQLLQLL